MKFGVVVPTCGTWSNTSTVLEAVQCAESLGFDTVWFGDHIVVPSYALSMSPPNWLESLSCAFYCAGATKKIRFGVDVLVLPYRNPVWLSQLLASADQLSGGRLTTGIGVGYVKGEFAALSTPDYSQRGKVTDEYLEVLRILWETEGPVSYQGQWVNFADIYAEPKPCQKPFPLWVGGNITAAQQRAATLGNGWHPLFPTLEVYNSGRQFILKKRREMGLTSPFNFSYSCPPTRIILNKNEARIESAVPYADNAPPEYSYAPSFPVAENGRRLFNGNPEEFISDLKALQAVGVEHITLRFSLGDEAEDLNHFTDQLQRFMAYVAPAINH